MSRPQVIDDEEHERVHDRVAAVDVAKDSGVVCTRLPHPSRPGARRSTVRTVKARMGAVGKLGRQLKDSGIELVTLESTSGYWRIWFFVHIAKARRSTNLKAFLKMCDQVEGQYRIRPAHPVIVRYPIERHPTVLEELRHAIAQYQETLPADRREVLRRYYFGDFARKVVGVGSVGTEAFVLLLLGDRPDEPLFLQLKEAQESVLAPFAGKSEYVHQGERVVKGQQLMQAASDPFLGWTSGIGTSGHGTSGDGREGLRVAAKDYYVRQLRDMKGSMSVSLMDPHQLANYGRLCGWALARAHARTGRAAMIAGYLGGSKDFDHAIADFAIAYVGQNERDYQQLHRAICDARILATVEP